MRSIQGFRVTALAAIAVLSSAGTLPAAVNFQFVAEQSSYDVTPGQTLFVKTYLRETISAPDTSLLVAENGLFSAGVRIVQSDATGTALAPSAVIGNSAEFDDPFTSSGVSATSAYIVEAVNSIGTGPTGAAIDASTREVLLATFQFDVPLGATGSTTYGISDLVSDDTVTNLGTQLDAQIASGSFAVTVVPEPASLGLALLLHPLLRRRRH